METKNKRKIIKRHSSGLVSGANMSQHNCKKNNFNLNDRLLFTINIYFCVFEHVHYEIPKSQLSHYHEDGNQNSLGPY